MISPEAPYPVAGGGQLRTACMLEYLAAKYTLDLIVFQEPGAPDPSKEIPRGLVRDTKVIRLPFHSKTMPARAARNFSRFLRQAPPLMDRFGGFELPVSTKYDVAVIEHFWCASYAQELRPWCDRLLLDLHNIESVLLERSAGARGFPGRILMRSFAKASRRTEAALLPRFDLVLSASETDRDATGLGIVWPNTIPLVPLPAVAKIDEVIFSGNMAYQPNMDAVQHFASRVWPLLRRSHPSLAWRLAGKNPDSLHLAPDERIRITGAMKDAIAEIAKARVAVVPLLSGSGTRFKIIEAWAAGTPVVSTTIGAEGLDAVDGEHLLIADTPQDFCHAILQVISDSALAGRLSRAGRTLYESRFTWCSAWKLLEAAGL